MKNSAAQKVKLSMMISTILSIANVIYTIKGNIVKSKNTAQANAQSLDNASLILPAVAIQVSLDMTVQNKFQGVELAIVHKMSREDSVSLLMKTKANVNATPKCMENSASSNHHPVLTQMIDKTSKDCSRRSSLKQVENRTSKSNSRL